MRTAIALTVIGIMLTATLATAALKKSWTNAAGDAHASAHHRITQILLDWHTSSIRMTVSTYKTKAIADANVNAYYRQRKFRIDGDTATTLLAAAPVVTLMTSAHNWLANNRTEFTGATTE